MINFTVGPVQTEEEIRLIGAEQVPYFRTADFSKLMLENETLMKHLVHAPKTARVVFITGSGTASMEAAVMNVLTKEDRALVVNGGSFGQRFVDLLTIYEISFDEIKLEHGECLTADRLGQYEGGSYTTFLVNVHETSTGVLYDMDMISDFCRKKGMLLIADAISSFLADPFDMERWAVDVMITGSQKALACPPGISIMVLSERAVQRIEANHVQGLYLNLKNALKDMERGQTSFTPAVGILRQIHRRLQKLEAEGGAEAQIAKMSGLANYFRERIIEFPFELVSQSMSNAVTPLHPVHTSAYRIFEILQDEYQIWVCPNGGDMRDVIFRVGHLGDLGTADYDALFDALKDMQKRGLL